MGFNKRHFNIDKLTAYHDKDNINGLTDCIGKTDAFLFQDEISREIINLWISGEKTKAINILERHKCT
jgi:hypothetical protein